MLLHKLLTAFIFIFVDIVMFSSYVAYLSSNQWIIVKRLIEFPILALTHFVLFLPHFVLFQHATSFIHWYLMKG
jgi:hypothetical protein